MSSVKRSVLEFAQQLPEECTWDDVEYAIQLRKQVEAGLKDVQEGRRISHEELVREFKA